MMLLPPAGSVWHALQVANAAAPALWAGGAATDGNAVSATAQNVAATGGNMIRDFIILSGLATIGCLI
ncbi:MAG: hypothetical protein MT490_05295 [Sphingomonas sp.]|uniref:hypothetical protein n=1 Tax=Sphingomonas sp. TaxID=28214 RepID=UPI0022754281|nr:hypothetical protein [Sphingomonas sp.]MCX8475195.1 hypothetical protein [Sphingomonas sp.]